jgi:hypothetical protein
MLISTMRNGEKYSRTECLLRLETPPVHAGISFCKICNLAKWVQVL